jgi:hypothetical protein
MILCEIPTSIKVHQDSILAVVDDDEAIHDAWDARFESIFSKVDNVKVLHFYTPPTFIDYYRTEQQSHAFYLIDYQFIGEALNGIDIIEQLNIANSCILETSAAEDPRLQQRAFKLDIKVLPKNKLFSIPVQIICLQPDLIYIDDNVSLTEAWKYKGEELGKRVAIFNKIDDLRTEINRYSKNTPIYIDSDLHADLSGEGFAKEIYESGFQNIYLATGHDKSRFKQVQWIKQIVGKDFPMLEQDNNANGLLESVRACMSHELRTPLAAIKTGVSGVKDFLPALIESYHMAVKNRLPVPEIQPRHLEVLTKTLDNVEKEAQFISDYVNKLLGRKD